MPSVPRRYKLELAMLASRLGESQKTDTKTMLMSPLGLRAKKGCAVDARRKLNSTDSTSRQRGRPTLTNLKLSKKIMKERMGKIGSGSQMGA
jgi:hypothetical protein